MRTIIALLAAAFVLAGCSSEDPTDDTPQRAGNSLSQSATPSQADRVKRFAVVGVRFDDSLNVRRQPVATAPVLGRLAPLATGVTATGRTSGAWQQVTIDEGTGWAHGRYLGHLGKTVDITEEARAVGIASTRNGLVRKVVAQQASEGDGPLAGPVLVARTANSRTADVLGYADDAVAGERFKVIVVAGEAGFEVKSATAIPICARGVSRAGLCV